MSQNLQFVTLHLNGADEKPHRHQAPGLRMEAPRDP